jgi:outer membrane receptor protein involved in Fe transport
MTAFELGYRTTMFKKIGFNIELYYNEVDDLIEYAIPKQTWPLLIGWDNAYNAIAKGIEISVDLPVTPWWTLNANYTFQGVEYKRFNKDTPGTPKHKFNLGSRLTFQNGFSLDVRTHYVDKTKWSGFLEDVKIDDYLRLDVRVSQKLYNDKLELSLVGQNLTDKLHPETSDGSGIYYDADQLIYGQVTIHF